MKTKIQTLGISILVVLFVALSNLAIAQVSYKIDSKKSKMEIKGTSTIHDWEMNVESVKGAITLQEDNNLSKLSNGNLEVDVKSIKSDHSLMNKKTYNALKEDDYPQIKAQLVSVD
ncbi:MAG TPA: YceI family protein, partial [Sunxiuqinia sp.]|nr:YceI family protein [Sunxiuqinia sp.]